METMEKGQLYVVATPIGNLGDITFRAIDVLKNVDLIAAEDTRHSGKLLSRYQIGTRMSALHEHNEQAATVKLIAMIEAGNKIALISDAGTPLISDPGYRLVCAAHEAGIQVLPIPGPCAAIAALSVAALPSDRFCFEGFLPAKSAARKTKLLSLIAEERTVLFYESPHRIMSSLADIQDVMGPDRRITVARELTKIFESVVVGSVADAIDFLDQNSERQQGEFVLIIEGAEPVLAETISLNSEQVLKTLLKELPTKKAAAVASELTGVSKNVLYQLALAIKP